MSQPENARIVHAGDGEQDAIAINDHIFMAHAISNSYLVTGEGEDLLINTGMPHQGAAIRARFAKVSSNPIAAIVLTQCHTDHIGGWQHFHEPGTEIITQANYADCRNYWNKLGPFMTSRSHHLWRRDIQVDQSRFPPDPTPTTTFHDHHELVVGGRQVELYSTPGGETTDSLVVWLPDERTLFTGNLTGPLFGHVPNLYTIRGDKIRSALAFINALNLIIALSPDLLITGHGDPIRGVGEIRVRLTKIRDATTYIRDKTFEGMNDGIDLWTLMKHITLPPELAIPQGHGKVPWLVRAIWEEHIGWFRYESTTELYAVPPAAVADDLVELIGGVEPLAARARDLLGAGRPLHALQLTDIALINDPTNRAALQVKLAAHQLLLERSGGENFSEVRWLESEIRDTEAALS